MILGYFIGDDDDDDSARAGGGIDVMALTRANQFYNEALTD